MKKKILFLSVVAFVMCSLLIQGCMKDENYGDSFEVTKADLVIASPEYQSYSKTLARHSQKIVTAFKKLSDEDKQKFKELINLNTRISDVDGMEEAGKILGYDLKAGYDNVNKKMVKIDFSGVSTEEFIRAKYRYYSTESKSYNIKRVRVRTMNSEEDNDDRCECSKDYCFGENFCECDCHKCECSKSSCPGGDRCSCDCHEGEEEEGCDCKDFCPGIDHCSCQCHGDVTCKACAKGCYPDCICITCHKKEPNWEEYYKCSRRCSDAYDAAWKACGRDDTECKRQANNNHAACLVGCDKL